MGRWHKRMCCSKALSLPSAESGELQTMQHERRTSCFSETIGRLRCAAEQTLAILVARLKL